MAQEKPVIAVGQLYRAWINLIASQAVLPMSKERFTDRNASFNTEKIPDHRHWRFQSPTSTVAGWNAAIWDAQEILLIIYPHAMPRLLLLRARWLWKGRARLAGINDFAVTQSRRDHESRLIVRWFSNRIIHGSRVRLNLKSILSTLLHPFIITPLILELFGIGAICKFIFSTLIPSWRIRYGLRISFVPFGDGLKGICATAGVTNNGMISTISAAGFQKSEMREERSQNGRKLNYPNVATMWW
jgi:hypothetical protein